jgi:hypothetical protein
MYSSNKEYVNRYGDKYKFVPCDNDTYEFKMEGDSLKYCRAGGKEGQKGLDMNDLGMFDPSGGPYIQLGMKVDEKPITRIFHGEENYFVECK